ncbi:MAG: class I SAM-dependent methyltransferase [Muribaculaceae bacterium]|nr:class I SAM-dependent methyltransferase [Muribaculaceae bacterium]
MDERSFFDTLSATWDDNEILSTPEKINLILDEIGIKKNDDVLDLGTGTGVLLPFLARRIGQEGSITAVDFSQGMLEKAKTKYSDLNPLPVFLNLDFENETIPGEYDHILLYSVYPHLHNPVETLKWLDKVNLKENGIISIAFPCGPDFINKIHRERHSDSDFLPSASDLAKLLTQNGLNAKMILDNDDSFLIKIYK